jgi:D-tyrosyl-tRNA(Tyr) deacylase
MLEMETDWGTSQSANPRNVKAVIQRVKEAKVTVNGAVVGSIGPGVCVLVGVGSADGHEDGAYLARKISEMRIFSDQEGKFNLSVKEIGGSILAVSEFTLYADCRKGRRPSFAQAAPPEKARALYETFVGRLRHLGLTVATGRFQAHMDVSLINDGPVTIILDSKTSE